MGVAMADMGERTFEVARAA